MEIGGVVAELARVSQTENASPPPQTSPTE